MLENLPYHHQPDKHGKECSECDVILEVSVDKEYPNRIEADVHNPRTKN